MPSIRSLILLAVFGFLAAAADWPQWLGPRRDGSSPEPVAAWEKAPKVLWRQPAGEGNSSVVVANGQAFVHAKVKGKNEEEVSAYYAATGNPLWQKSYPRAAFNYLYGNGPRATPAVAGDKLYTFGITGVLTCFETATGKQIWQVDTMKQFGAPNPTFGMSCSPLVDDNRVLLNVGAKGASVVAFDKDKGDVLWKSLDDRASYSSPIVVGEGKERQIIFLTQQGVVSLDPANGSVYWKYPLVDQLFESSATPARCGDMLLASSITFGSVGLQLENKDAKPKAEELWKNQALTSYFSTPIAVGSEHLYLVTGSSPLALTHRATLHCVDAKTGRDLWSKPKQVGKYHASLLRTGDNKLLLLEEAGELVLLDPDPKEYRELARSKVCGETWAHPALANGRLYLRDDKEIMCLELGH
jgi:outer membrane protein assembly factor BamB